jgi:hypothetical protein
MSEAVQVIEDSPEETMVSLRTEPTGVRNTIFIATRDGQHAAHIAIAIDPPHSLDPTATKVTMSIHDYSVGVAYLPPHIAEQAKQFVDRNRETLLRYWNHEIDTEEMIRRLQPAA